MLVEAMLGMSLLVGCGGTPMDQQVPIGRSRLNVRAIDTLGLDGVVMAPAAKVWEALPAILGDLGLEINFRDPAGRRVGTCYQTVRGRLGKEALSSYLDCGETRSVPNADEYEVAVTVLVTVEATSPNITTIHTFLIGVGSHPSVASNRIWCFPKGVLEERVRTAVEARAKT